ACRWPLGARSVARYPRGCCRSRRGSKRYLGRHFFTVSIVRSHRCTGEIPKDCSTARCTNPTGAAVLIPFLRNVRNKVRTLRAVLRALIKLRVVVRVRITIPRTPAPGGCRGVVFYHWCGRSFLILNIRDGVRGANVLRGL